MRFIVKEIEPNKSWKYELKDNDDKTILESNEFCNRDACTDEIADIKRAPTRIFDLVEDETFKIV